MARKKLDLTEEQKKYIRSHYDKMGLLELTRELYKNPKLDGRSIEGYTVKMYIISLGGKPKTTARDESPDIQLTDEQKEYIENNVGPDNGFTEIARTLFNNDRLTPLHKESRVVHDYIKNNISQTFIKEGEELAPQIYFPPKAISKLLKLVNENAKQEYVEEKLTGAQRDELLCLGRFLAFPLFIYKINTFQTVAKRKLFEGTFVSYVYNKPDLSVEEVNQYIALSEEHVIESDVNSQIETINNRFSNAKGDDREYTMKLVEMLKTLTTKRESCVNRQAKLFKSLVEDRSKRKDNVMSENMALTQWFQLWQDKEERDLIIKIAQRRKMERREEIDRIASIDSTLAKIAGLGYVEFE